MGVGGKTRVSWMENGHFFPGMELATRAEAREEMGHPETEGGECYMEMMVFKSKATEPPTLECPGDLMRNADLEE